MGHAIERIALERGHKIVCKIDADNIEDFESSHFRSADVAIEFSQPGQAVDNLLKSFAAGVPVVCGTTGWTYALPEIKDMCEKGAATLFYSSNYSIGVALFRAASRYLAELMNGYPEYKPEVTEVHHIHKLDHPSGTAITIAEDLIGVYQAKTSWAEPEPEKELKAEELAINHEREGEVPGRHTVVWDSPADTITIRHNAKSRDGLALGAVIAAEWLNGRSGYFTMEDMLPFLKK